jgi:tetratricopeptide (TPR) repeat protein
VVAVALVLGLAGTAVGLVRARAQRVQAEAARAEEGRQRELAQTRLAQTEATVQFLDDMLGAADPGAQGKDVTVREVLDKASASIGPQYKSQPLVAARLHGTVARTYLALGEYTEADTHAQEALALCRRELGDDHPDTCKARNAVAAMLVKRGEYDAADALLTKALEDHTRLFGRKHDLTAQTIDQLAQLRALQSRNAEAVTMCAELADIRAATLGPEDISTISALNTLATALVDLDRFEESESTFQRAITAEGKARGAETPLALELRANLQWLYYWWGMRVKESDASRHDTLMTQARTLGEETLRARTRVLGEDHPETLTSVNNLAAVYRNLGMHDEADRMTLREIEGSIKALGEDHPDTITSIANMGNSLRTRKRYTEAVTYLDRALRSARKALPADAQGTSFILGWYGSCLRDLGRHAEAESMLTESRAMMVRLTEEDHPISTQMSLGLQLLYEAWDKAEPGKGYDAKAREWKARFEQDQAKAPK